MGSCSISVAMIVKDEAGQLGGCLAALAGLADEICVVDTGSTDATLAVARRHGARINQFDWCDDFAAARNASIGQCSGTWIFVVDADERIAGKDVPRIRALAEGPDDRAYRFVTRNYTAVRSVSEFHPCAAGDPHGRGFPGWFPSTKVRLFPNRPGARFEGQVHETVHRSLAALGLDLVACDIPIHHYPFSKSLDQIQRKQALYLRLGRMKIAAAPNDAQAYAELGHQCAEIGDYANAALAYRDCLKRDPANAGALKDLGSVLYLLQRREEAKRALRLAVERDAALIEAWRNLGVILAEEHAWPAAVECFERCMALDADCVDGWRYLGVALEGAGRIGEAVTASRKALEADPANVEAIDLYLHQMAALNRSAEARAFLDRLNRPGPRNA